MLQMTDFIHELDKWVCSNKGYSLGSRTAPRFRKVCSVMRNFYRLTFNFYVIGFNPFKFCADCKFF